MLQVAENEKYVMLVMEYADGGELETYLYESYNKVLTERYIPNHKSCRHPKKRISRANVELSSLVWSRFHMLPNKSYFQILSATGTIFLSFHGLNTITSFCFDRNTQGIMKQILDGVEYCHRRKVIHRDLCV